MVLWSCCTYFKSTSCTCSEHSVLTNPFFWILTPLHVLPVSPLPFAWDFALRLAFQAILFWISRPQISKCDPWKIQLHPLSPVSSGLQTPALDPRSRCLSLSEAFHCWVSCCVYLDSLAIQHQKLRAVGEKGQYSGGSSITVQKPLSYLLFQSIIIKHHSTLWKF